MHSSDFMKRLMSVRSCASTGETENYKVMNRLHFPIDRVVAESQPQFTMDPSRATYTRFKDIASRSGELGTNANQRFQLSYW